MNSSSYVIAALAATLAALAPRLSAIEQKAVGREAVDERTRFVGRAEKELEDIDRRIDELQAKAKERGRAERIELEKRVDRLERSRQRAEGRLQELRATSGERWRVFRGHVSDLIEELREDVGEITEEEAGRTPTPPR